MMEHWIATIIEQHHFPFFEFICIMFLLLQWSVIARLKRMEKSLDGIEEEILEDINYD